MSGSSRRILLHISILKEQCLQVQNSDLRALQQYTQRAAALLGCQEVNVRVNGDGA